MVCLWIFCLLYLTAFSSIECAVYEPVDTTWTPYWNEYWMATQLCKDTVGMPAMPKTQAENDVLDAYTGEGKFWLGLRRTAQGWQWEDGTYLGAWSNWLQAGESAPGWDVKYFGEPNGTYAFMMKSAAKDGYSHRWGATYDRYLKMDHIVCQQIYTGPPRTITVTPTEPLRKALQCQEGPWLYIDCDAQWGGQIVVEKAIFGNDENATVSQQECPNHHWKNVCSNSQSTIDSITKQIKYRCDGRAGCSMLVHRGWWGDTCHGNAKYMKVYYRCVDALPEAQSGPSHTISVCGWHDQHTIVCDPSEGTRIHIQKVWYGNPPDAALAKAQCPNHTWLLHCIPKDRMLSNHFAKTRRTCEGKSECMVNHRTVLRGGDSCYGKSKMLTIVYNCY